MPGVNVKQHRFSSLIFIVYQRNIYLIQTAQKRKIYILDFFVKCLIFRKFLLKNGYSRKYFF